MKHPIQYNNQAYTLTDDDCGTLFAEFARILSQPVDLLLSLEAIATCFEDTWQLTRGGDWWHVTVYDPDYPTVETAHYAAQTVTLVYALAVCGEHGYKGAWVGKL